MHYDSKHALEDESGSAVVCEGRTEGEGSGWDPRHARVAGQMSGPLTRSGEMDGSGVVGMLRAADMPSWTCKWVRGCDWEGEGSAWHR